MSLAERIRTIQAPATLEMTARAAALRASGVDVVSFSIGEPDFATPAHIREAAFAAAAAGQTKYTAVAGTLALRKAISRRVTETTGAPCGPERVVVTAGAKQSLFNVAFALYDEGDEVVIPAPYWVTYPEQVRLAGATPIIVQTREEDGFVMRAAALQAVLTPRTRAVILSTPNNPTGGAYDAKTLAELAEVLGPTNAHLVSDEIYAALVYDGERHASILQVAPPALRDRTVLVDGASKTYAMTGWRLGWSVSSPALAEAMETVQGQVSSNASSISQAAALAALEGDQACVESMRQTFEARRNLMVQGLRQIPGVRCVMPRGAFYAFASFQDVIARGDPRARDSLALSTYLLDAAKVATVPGSAFGTEGYVRLSYATSEETIREGLGRISAAVGALRG